MPLVVNNQQDKVPVEPTLKKLLIKVGAQAIALASLQEKAEVSLALVDDQQIRELNHQYRQVDASTDVLSFALKETGQGEPWLEDAEEECLGDVVISLETAGRQAEEYGRSFQQEVAFLLIHGILHLAGYDHERDSGTRLMQAKEAEVLKAAGLSVAEDTRVAPRPSAGKGGLKGDRARAFLADRGIEAKEILDLAWEARRQAYAPYSGLAVGAAVLGRSGRIYQGCNVENASYGLALCAERGALSQAVLGGERGLAAVAVVAHGSKRLSPCGSCRQALAEFGRNQVVITQTDPQGEFRVYSLEELLPVSFCL